MTPIDRSDRMILKLLQEDGRRTTVEISERIGLSHTATSERIKRLTRDGVILGYGARLDPRKLGRAFLVFLEVTLDKTTPDIFEQFAAAIRRAPDVLECHMVAGGFDYLVKARVADMAAYRVFLSGVMLALPGVKETRSYPVIEEVVDGAALPVR